MKIKSVDILKEENIDKINNNYLNAMGYEIIEGGTLTPFKNYFQLSTMTNF